MLADNMCSLSQKFEEKETAKEKQTEKRIKKPKQKRIKIEEKNEKSSQTQVSRKTFKTNSRLQNIK